MSRPAQPAASERLRQLSRACEGIADELDATSPLADADKDTIEDGRLERLAERILRLRREREALFGPDLFADPVWDMLLDLFAQRRHARPISVSSLCIAASVPATTALRYMALMEAKGLITRSPAADDGRRRHVALTGAALLKVQGLLERAERLGNCL